MFNWIYGILSPAVLRHHCNTRQQSSWSLRLQVTTNQHTLTYYNNILTNQDEKNDVFLALPTTSTSSQQSFSGSKPFELFNDYDD